MRIALVTLGGTISSEPLDGDTSPGPDAGGGGVVPVSGAATFVREVAPFLPDLTVVPVEMRMVPSPSLTVADLRELSACIAELVEDGDGVDGVVVAQGTDTIEETAYALDLVGAADEVPVVVTGAMRDRTAPGPDGAANVVAALRTAASPDARGRGVLVVFADRVHAARWVTKTSTFKVDAFTSEPFGPVGIVAEGRVRLGATPRPLPPFESPDGPPAKVAIVTAGLGDDLAVLPALGDAGYDGVVLVAMGAGHVPAAAVDAVAFTAQTMPVVLCSRTGAGPVFTHTYGYEGGEIDLLERGVLPGGTLTPTKARLLLMLLLASGLQGRELAHAFARHAEA
ncbi:asparaginase [Sanguibacter sp. HDW7]|uniref:asparaginase n=1 Tax=Sanguibacter sp. HDW7 TaxID=2714931 RepID=UPI00140DCFBB|nr:asparaginase [Sanguibacter sp. HDW7]QIK84648.1 asparaginase [Sanguibacter sp. HDW7]